MRSVTVRPLTGGEPATQLRCGSRSVTIPCVLGLDETLALPAPLIAELGLAPGDRVNLVEQRSTLQIGPLVGVMLGHGIEELLNGPWIGRYREMTREARAVGTIPFFFSLEGISLEGERVDGWVERRGSWEPVTLPLPDLIYNRATYREKPDRKRAAFLLRELRLRHGTQLINSRNAFSKAEVADGLRFFAGTRDLIPETLPFDEPEQLMEMLERHRCVFMKADHGSHASEVLRIRAIGDQWEVRGTFGGQPVLERFDDPDVLTIFLDLLRRSTRCVIQQGIDLPSVDGRLFDLRVILQKDGLGAWRVPLVLIRMAQTEKVAANMSQGGHPFLPAAFSSLFGDQLNLPEGFEERAAEAALKVAAAMESRSGRMGEMGVDLGIDRSGRAWIFEANTKPLHPMLPDLPEPLVRWPFHYAVHLAERAWRGRETRLTDPVRL